MWDSRKLLLSQYVPDQIHLIDDIYVSTALSTKINQTHNMIYECRQTTTNILLKWGCISEVSVGSETGNDKAFMFP